jgi:hypothetical protein
VRTVALLPADDGRAVRLWDVRADAAAMTLRVGDGEGSGMCTAVSAWDSGGVVVAGYEDGRVFSFDIVAGRQTGAVAAAKQPGE